MRAQRAQESESPMLAHRTSTVPCPVCTEHPGGPTSQKLQRSNPTAVMTWQGAPDTVRCAPDCPVRHRTDSLPTATFGGWGYNYPNHPTIHCIQVFHFPTTTRALAFNSVHRTVRCAIDQAASQRPLLVVGAINTPTTPPFIASKFSTSQPLTRASHSILDTPK